MKITSVVIKKVVLFNDRKIILIYGKALTSAKTIYKLVIRVQISNRICNIDIDNVKSLINNVISNTIILNDDVYRYYHSVMGYELIVDNKNKLIKYYMEKK